MSIDIQRLVEAIESEDLDFLLANSKVIESELKAREKEKKKQLKKKEKNLK